MVKRFSIALLFLTAFTVMIAHDLIPHHHPDEETVASQQDKDHDNDLDNLFSHFQHITVGNQSISSQQVISVEQVFFLSSISYNFIFSGTAEPVPILFNYQPPIYTSSCIAAFALRGPPSITG